MKITKTVLRKIINEERAYAQFEQADLDMLIYELSKILGGEAGEDPQRDKDFLTWAIEQLSKPGGDTYEPEG